MSGKLIVAAAKSWKTTRRWSLQTLAEMGGQPNNTNAKLLLTDVALRLAGQHSTCTELMDSVKRLVENDGESSLSSVNPTTSSTKKVIRAINHPVHKSFKQEMQRWQSIEQEADKAYGQLHNLRVLHADTLHLTRSLLDNKNLLERFNEADQHVIAAVMEQVRSRHATTVETLADVCIGLRQVASESQLGSLKDLVSILETFLRGRLSVQLLCDHYVALSKDKPHGGVSVECSLHDVLDDALTEAKHMCDAHYNTTPEVVMTKENHRVTMIRPWVHHVLVELLKNAMASAVERAERDQSLHPLCVHIRTRKQSDEMFLDIIDQGIGLDGGSGAVHRAFGFAQSSADQRWDRLEDQQSYAMVRSPLQSLGVGLPLSRMMMRHFGGDVTLDNRAAAEGGLETGCTAVVKMNTVDSIKEILPGDI